MAKTSQDWFAVSREGLRELQAGKPKHFIARELIQNAFDEDVKMVDFQASWKSGVARIVVLDDSPEGFRNLADSFTIFGPTYKRSDPEKRGRFNLGEKQAIALAEEAHIATTKGLVSFGKEGRTETSEMKRAGGSSVLLHVKMTRAEFEEMQVAVEKYRAPWGVRFVVNGVEIKPKEPEMVAEASLPTEILSGGVLKKTKRTTRILINTAKKPATLFEMGIPVTEIDCDYDIDVQQKIPLSPDRETVPESYLTALYAEVLNEVHTLIGSENASETWVRRAAGHSRASDPAVTTVMLERYGEKAVIADSNDRTSIDEAVSRGYRVIYGAELSGDEWKKVKKAEVLQTSSQMFGMKTTAQIEAVKTTNNMKVVRALVKKIGGHCLGMEVDARFGRWEGSVQAQFGDGVVTFNLKNLGEGFFDPPVSRRVLDLIIHELAHEKGHHTEKSYHEALTKIGAELIMMALEMPAFFKVDDHMNSEFRL